MTRETASPDEWFALGDRVPYDSISRRVLSSAVKRAGDDIVHVFRRRVARSATGDPDATVVSLLPGWPDGSYGYAGVEAELARLPVGPRLYLDYVGHGDSDKPGRYRYSTFERADLVEALWAAERVRDTAIVAFDYSCIATLEILARVIDRRREGKEAVPAIRSVLLINGGAFADGHTDPWFTTPLLESALGGILTWIGQRSRRAFLPFFRPAFSRAHVPRPGELAAIYLAMRRRNGIAVLHRTARFVREHQENRDRWDLGRVASELGGEIPFHVAGSEEDRFEGRQLPLATERLGGRIRTHSIPGGHLATFEYPGLIARLIADASGRPG